MRHPLFASPAYLARHGVPRTPRDLKQHQIINRRFLNGSYSKWSFRSTDGSVETFEPEASAVTRPPPKRWRRQLCQASELLR
jgi:hypothetical protein